MKPKLNCIMLIDDDKLTNLFNEITIGEMKCTNHIIKLESALAGIKYLCECASKVINTPFPEIIFLDIDMPKDTGWDFLDFYRDIKDDLPAKPLIFLLSSSKTTHNLNELTHRDLLGIYKKPLTSGMITGILDKYFPG